MAVENIGVGQVRRQIIERTVVNCLKIDLKVLGGDQHLCMGQKKELTVLSIY